MGRLAMLVVACALLSVASAHLRILALASRIRR